MTPDVCLVTPLTRTATSQGLSTTSTWGAADAAVAVGGPGALQIPPDGRHNLQRQRQKGMSTRMSLLVIRALLDSV
eukprot:UN11681